MLHVLVVDDHAPTLSALSALLSRDGCDVHSFTVPHEALDALERMPFDVVMTDLEMPEVSGAEVVRATRQYQPAACLVVASADAREQYVGLLASGVCIVTPKPMEYAALFDELLACRERGGPGAHGTCRMRCRPPQERLIGLLKKGSSRK
jgi:CheY-like chemotaxis protein